MSAADIERWFIQVGLNDSQRDIVESIIAQRDERITELVAEVNRLTEAT